MKILYIARDKARKIFNMKNTDKFQQYFRDAYQYVDEKWTTFAHHISSGSANSLVSMIIVATTAFVITIGTANVSVVLADKELKLAKLKVEIAEEKTRRDLEIAKVRADAMVGVAEYQARQEEARAATNPYIAAANHGKSSPVNVFIETSDGATEIAISTITVKGTKYTPSQRKLMEMAWHIGKEVGFPETIQAFLLQETLAGAFGDRIGDTNLPIGKRSYGVMQMKVATSRKVMRRYPTLVSKYFPTRKTLKRVRDEELIIKLIQDDEFNIRLAALNFVIHRKASKSWSQAVVAYNTGQGAANKIDEPKEHVYYRKIIKRLIGEVRPFNRKANLSI